tara:strand:+ start:4740 stop:5735 length:996 start_codon:yes stop_codon:yes gene_type:complete
MKQQYSGLKFWTAIGIAIAVFLIAGLGVGVAVFLPNEVELNAEFDVVQFLEHLAILAVIATAIERATQSVLLLTKSDGTERSVVEATGEKPQDGSRAAMMVSLPLGLAVGLTGIGVITPLIQIESADPVSLANVARDIVTALEAEVGQLVAPVTPDAVNQAVLLVSEGSVDLSRSILRGVDTIVTGGLLAGGASGIHQVAEAVKALVRSPDRARANILTGGPITDNAPVITLELSTKGTQLWHMDRVFSVEGSDQGLREGTYHRVALRGGATEYMFLEFPLTTEAGRIHTITTADLAGGGLSMAPEDLSALSARLGNTARDDLKIVIRRLS